MIIAGTFNDGFYAVWHYAGYVVGGAVALAIVLWILAALFDW